MYVLLLDAAEPGVWSIGEGEGCVDVFEGWLGVDRA